MATDKVADEAFLPTDTRRITSARRAVDAAPAPPIAARRAVPRRFRYNVVPFVVPVAGPTPVRILGSDASRITIVFTSAALVYFVGPFATDVVAAGWKVAPVGSGELGQVMFTEGTHHDIIGWEWWGASTGASNIVGWEIRRR